MSLTSDSTVGSCIHIGTYVTYVGLYLHVGDLDGKEFSNHTQRQSEKYGTGTDTWIISHSAIMVYYFYVPHLPYWYGIFKTFLKHENFSLFYMKPNLTQVNLKNPNLKLKILKRNINNNRPLDHEEILNFFQVIFGQSPKP
jgi:hypothetical protein